LVISPPATVLAQDESPAEDKLELISSFPKMEIMGETVEFSVRLKWWGSEDRVFDLSATVPKDWLVYFKPSYAETIITAISLEPGKTEYPETIKVIVVPRFQRMPEPGEYTITVEASSGDLKDTVELKAIITAWYDINLVPTLEQRYNTKATAGKDTSFSVDIENNSTATVDSIAFSSYKPEGWTIDFSPAGLSSLAAGNFQTIDINIKPPPKTIAGDYYITLRASGEQATADSIRIRVTVKTPTIWGWVGVVIIVLVIAGLAFVVMRFSRR
jgi:uncharacterized membrane protein